MTARSTRLPGRHPVLRRSGLARRRLLGRQSGDPDRSLVHRRQGQPDAHGRRHRLPAGRNVRRRDDRTRQRRNLGCGPHHVHGLGRRGRDLHGERLLRATAGDGIRDGPRTALPRLRAQPVRPGVAPQQHRRLHLRQPGRAGDVGGIPHLRGLDVQPDPRQRLLALRNGDGVGRRLRRHGLRPGHRQRQRDRRERPQPGDPQHVLPRRPPRPRRLLEPQRGARQHVPQRELVRVPPHRARRGLRKPERDPEHELPGGQRPERAGGQRDRLLGRAGGSGFLDRSVRADAGNIIRRNVFFHNDRAGWR